MGIYGNDISNIFVFNEDSRKDEKIAGDLVPLISHLLKFKYQPEKQSSSWLNTIKNHYIEIIKLIGKDKNVYKKLESKYIIIYEKSIKEAVNEMNKYKNYITKDAFYNAYPFPEITLDNVLDPNFINSWIDTYKSHEIAIKWINIHGNNGKVV